MNKLSVFFCLRVTHSPNSPPCFPVNEKGKSAARRSLAMNNTNFWDDDPNLCKKKHIKSAHFQL